MTTEGRHVYHYLMEGSTTYNGRTKTIDGILHWKSKIIDFETYREVKAFIVEPFSRDFDSWQWTMASLSYLGYEMVEVA